MSSRRNHKVITVKMLVCFYLQMLVGASEKELAIPVIVNNVSYETTSQDRPGENTSTGYTWTTVHQSKRFRCFERVSLTNLKRVKNGFDSNLIIQPKSLGIFE
jgi:hypothetical protein